jgi:cyclopropane fatty-acyl-phospholipid synthase-like methyltransferase
VQVTGIELAEEIVKLVQERAVDLGLSDKVNFLLQDAVLADFESETFSIIHFGESLMHFKHEDKVPMLKKVKKWLKPGGQLIIRDICTSDVLQTSQNEFKQFCSSANYHFLKIAEYCQIISDVGLRLTHCEDRRLSFANDLRRTRTLADTNKDILKSVVPRDVFDFTVTFWTDYQKWIDEGAVGEVLIYAVNEQQHDD